MVQTVNTHVTQSTEEAKEEPAKQMYSDVNNSLSLTLLGVFHLGTQSLYLLMLWDDVGVLYAGIRTTILNAWSNLSPKSAGLLIFAHPVNTRAENLLHKNLAWNACLC